MACAAVHFQVHRFEELIGKRDLQIIIINKLNDVYFSHLIAVNGTSSTTTTTKMYFKFNTSAHFFLLHISSLDLMPIVIKYI